MNNIKWKPLLISIGISLGTGIFASILTRDSMQQYGNMYNPPLAPPAWLFPVVWTILYILMGIAAYLVYISDAEGKERALRTYGFQLAVYFFWTIIFFNFNAYLLAFAWLVLLWYLIFLTIRQFKEIKETAAWLLFPYLLWVTFAGYLNLAIAVYYL